MKSNRKKARLWIVFIALLIIFQSPRAMGAAEDDAATRIDEYMKSKIPADGPGAVLLVVQDGKVVIRKGYGLANVELGVPNDPEVVFALGSITKQFTGVSILMLEEQGKLSVKDEITKYIPDFPNQGRKITIENLLTHTSGIANFTSFPRFMDIYTKNATISEVIDFFKNEPLRFEPGEKYEYSNSGYFLLGAIIENVSGMSYPEFIQKRIFDPLNMTHSYYGSWSRIIPKRANGYEAELKNENIPESPENPLITVNASYFSWSIPLSAGALMSTVDDLRLWTEGLMSGKLISKSSLEKAWTPYELNSGKASGYGYGWNTIGGKEGMLRYVDHGGGINGFHNLMGFRPEDRTFVCLLTNGVEGVHPSAYFKVLSIIYSFEKTMPKEISLKGKELSTLTGVYEDARGGLYQVVNTGYGLRFFDGEWDAKDILPSSSNDFFVKGLNVNSIHFMRDSRGNVIGMKYTPYPHVRTYDLTKSVKRVPFPMKKTKVSFDVLRSHIGVYENDHGESFSIEEKQGEFYFVSLQGKKKMEYLTEKRFYVPSGKNSGIREWILDESGRIVGMRSYKDGLENTTKLSSKKTAEMAAAPCVPAAGSQDSCCKKKE